jgi:hypothetical protein
LSSVNTDHSIPAWHPDPQEHAVAQERSRHDQALASFGEYVMFVLMWRIDDHEAGLVDRCPRCYEAYGKTAEAYGQPAQERCPECFGTTFEGGWKARIVRPSLWDYNEEEDRQHARGEVEVATATVQSTSDFRLRTGDHLFRGDGTRWMMRTVSTNNLRTGFQIPSRQRSALGFNYGQVSLEDESSTPYLIPPSPAEVKEMLDLSHLRHPTDFSAVEEIRGPLR